MEMVNDGVLKIIGVDKAKKEDMTSTTASKLIEMKLPRVDKEGSSFANDAEMKSVAENLIRQYIDTTKEKGMNYFYVGSGKPSSAKHFFECDPNKILGFMDDFDDDYVYCRVFADKVDQIIDDYKMSAAYAAIVVDGKTKPSKFVRMELKELNV